MNLLWLTLINFNKMYGVFSQYAYFCYTSKAGNYLKSFLPVVLNIVNPTWSMSKPQQ